LGCLELHVTMIGGYFDRLPVQAIRWSISDTGREDPHIEREGTVSVLCRYWNDHVVALGGAHTVRKGHPQHDGRWPIKPRTHRRSP
jgi:hypothetical protein